MAASRHQVQGYPPVLKFDRVNDICVRIYAPMYARNILCMKVCVSSFGCCCRSCCALPPSAAKASIQIDQHKLSECHQTTKCRAEAAVSLEVELRAPFKKQTKQKKQRKNETKKKKFTTQHNTKKTSTHVTPMFVYSQRSHEQPPTTPPPPPLKRRQRERPTWCSSFSACPSLLRTKTTGGCGTEIRWKHLQQCWFLYSAGMGQPETAAL